MLSRPGRRLPFALTALLLTLPAAAAVTLSTLYVTSARRHRALVLATAVKVADDWLRDIFDIVHTRAFQTGLPVWRALSQSTPALDDFAHGGPGELVGDALDRCNACARPSLRGTFVWDPTTARIVTRPAEAAPRLGKALRGLPWTAPNPRDRITTVAGTDTNGPFMLLLQAMAVGKGDTVWNGIDLRLDSLGILFDEALSATARERGVTGAQLGDAVFMRVVHPFGAVIFERGPTAGLVETSQIIWGAREVYTVTLGEMSGYRTTLRITEAGFPALIGAPPPASPWPLALTVGFSVILVTALALLLLARQHQLVVDRERFVAGVSHELRTPLTQILLYGETLQLDRPTPVARRDAACVIVRETRRLIHLVEDVLAFGRGQHSTARLNPVPLAVVPVLASALASLRETASARGVTLDSRVDPEAAIHGDAVALEQILRNLVDNAIRHGRDGGCVAVAVSVASGMIECTVDDDGPGLPPSVRERIWQPFVRLAPESSEGTGVGLAVVRQLVELMGGTVYVDDAPSGGARFGVRLPRTDLPAIPTPMLKRMQT